MNANWEVEFDQRDNSFLKHFFIGITSPVFRQFQGNPKIKVSGFTTPNSARPAHLGRPLTTFRRKVQTVKRSCLGRLSIDRAMRVKYLAIS
jgi:hypothetical protein